MMIVARRSRATKAIAPSFRNVSPNERSRGSKILYRAENVFPIGRRSSRANGRALQELQPLLLIERRTFQFGRAAGVD